MVVKVRYKKRDGEVNDYYVFVLQPKYKGYFSLFRPKTHYSPSVVKVGW